VYICCGPLFKSSRRQKTVGGNVRVRVPNGFFKVVLSLCEGAEKAIGFVYSNRDSRQPMDSAVCTVDSVEMLTGLDFFPLLPDSLEDRVEASSNLKAWK
jgi:endonuclease G